MSTTNELAAIPRTDLFRTVLGRLEDYVANAQPGDRLPSDRRLAEDLGVSRPLVRQAIKVLEGLGLVHARQGVGTFVLSRSADDGGSALLAGLPHNVELVRQVLGARRIVEAAILREAFAHRTPEAIRALEESVQEQASGLSEEPQEVRLDIRFERTLGEICRNEVLRRIQAALHQSWLNVQISLEPANAQATPYHLDHVHILDAFRDGDLDGALQRLDEHLGALDR